MNHTQQLQLWAREYPLLEGRNPYQVALEIYQILPSNDKHVLFINIGKMHRDLRYLAPELKTLEKYWEMMERAMVHCDFNGKSLENSLRISNDNFKQN